MEFAWVKDAVNFFRAFAIGDDPTEACGGCAQFSGGDGGGIGAFFAWAIMPGQGGEAGGGFFVSQGRGIEKLEAAEGVGAVDQDQSVFACVLASGIDGPIEFLNLACGEIRLILACGEGDERVIDDEKVAEKIVGESLDGTADEIGEADGAWFAGGRGEGQGAWGEESEGFAGIPSGKAFEAGTIEEEGVIEFLGFLFEVAATGLFLCGENFATAPKDEVDAGGIEKLIGDGGGDGGVGLVGVEGGYAWGGDGA